MTPPMTRVHVWLTGSILLGCATGRSRLTLACHAGPLRRQPPDTIDESVEEGVDVRRHGDIQVGRPTPVMPPVSNRLPSRHVPPSSTSTVTGRVWTRSGSSAAASASGSWMKAPVKPSNRSWNRK